MDLANRIALMAFGGAGQARVACHGTGPAMCPPAMLSSRRCSL